MDRYLVISSDGHAGPRPEVYRDYLDPQYRAEFDVQHAARMAALEQAGEMLEMRQETIRWGQDKAHGLAGAWDSDRRNEILDADGVAAEILFVDGLTESNSPPFGGDLGLQPVGVVPELQWAGARAHNRWMAEFVAQCPLRRFGLASVTPYWGVDEAVKEVRWARVNGLRGIMLPHMMTGQDPYHHPKYEPLWRVCAELGMVIHFHSGAAQMQEYFGAALFGPQAGAEPPVPLPGALGIYVTEVAWWLTRPLVFMIWGGVFERHPQLKVAITEGSTIWVPELLALMDQRFGDHHFSAKLGTGIWPAPRRGRAGCCGAGCGRCRDRSSTRRCRPPGRGTHCWAGCWRQGERRSRRRRSAAGLRRCSSPASCPRPMRRATASTAGSGRGTPTTGGGPR